ncbi:MAG: type II toxin-antitoxin system HicA family toxin [Candidatus Sungbacteria bacterium]|uniref:Type II toxin-antitoxin system HicA family toxin n=1 Tax=Candidatus Sungiibacteriota bacterium TaxID=2750080 RepID=A0A931SB32_9BACT|nr:type II toxin-antitoxin system HicA family toxin [Candidatus Sungbacteria bacterium]
MRPRNARESASPYNVPKLPRIPSALVLRALKRARFYEYHQTGSHVQLRHPEKLSLRITIPFHRKDFAPKTLKTIIKQAGLTVDEFLKLL